MENLLLGLLFDIYSGLCTALSTLFMIFLHLSTTTLDSISFKQIIDNIYILLSVLMTFYITFNLITYIANPEKITDKAKGGTKLLVNIVITLALLVFTPTIFSISRDLQTAILKDNILAKIIISTEDEMTDDYFKSTSYLISRTITRAYLTPKVENGDSAIELEEDMFMTGDSTSMSSLRSLAQDTTNYNFNWIMAIVTAVLLCLVVFGFLFDIAVRIIKLLFMEIIAPIPILFYPFKKDNFTNWLKATGAAYGSLFIRLALIYFVIYLINALTDMSWNQENPVIFSFIIIGVLLFAKQLPQLISDIFGIKLDGKFSLNPMDRIREVPLLGGAVSTGLAALGGAVTGTALGFKAAGGINGIANEFKTYGAGWGMRKIGSTARTSLGMGARATLYGGRAGFQQAGGFGGVIKGASGGKGGSGGSGSGKPAYTAGASAVAQAITGSDKASSGIADRFFNDLGTQLNEPMYQQEKAIANAEKEYDKAVSELAVLHDSQREIESNLGAASADYSTYAQRISGLKAQAAHANQLEVQYNRYSNDIDSVIKEEQDKINVKIENNGKSFRNQILTLEGQANIRRNEIQQSRETRIAAATGEYTANMEYCKQMIDMGVDVDLYQQMYNDSLADYNSAVTLVDARIANEIEEVNKYEDTMKQQYQQQYFTENSRLVSERNNVENEVLKRSVEIENEYKSLNFDKTAYEQQLSELERTAEPYKARYEEYQRQYNRVSEQVKNQEQTVAKKKEDWDEQKNIKKYREGPFHSTK